MPPNAVLVIAGEYIADFNTSLTECHVLPLSNLCYETQLLFLFSKYPGVVHEVYNVNHYLELFTVKPIWMDLVLQTTH